MYILTKYDKPFASLINENLIEKAIREEFNYSNVTLEDNVALDYGERCTLHFTFVADDGYTDEEEVEIYRVVYY